jgi:hypothetical protein
MKPGFSRALFIERGFSPGKRRRDPRSPGVDPSWLFLVLANQRYIIG